MTHHLDLTLLKGRLVIFTDVLCWCCVVYVLEFAVMKTTRKVRFLKHRECYILSYDTWIMIKLHTFFDLTL